MEVEVEMEMAAQKEVRLHFVSESGTVPNHLRHHIRPSYFLGHHFHENDTQHRYMTASIQRAEENDYNDNRIGTMLEDPCNGSQHPIEQQQQTRAPVIYPTINGAVGRW